MRALLAAVVGIGLCAATMWAAVGLGWRLGEWWDRERAARARAREALANADADAATLVAEVEKWHGLGCPSWYMPPVVREQ